MRYLIDDQLSKGANDGKIDLKHEKLKKMNEETELDLLPKDDEEEVIV